MKNIELTEEHKSKLLEMCKILFPEYTTIPNDKNPKFLTINWFTKQGYFIHLMDDDDLKENKMIHWLEFCMTHLIVKLSKEFTKQKLSEADYTDNQYPNWFSEKVSYHLNPFRNEEFEEDILFIHPVDYLYEEFKKLK